MTNRDREILSSTLALIIMILFVVLRGDKSGKLANRAEEVYDKLEKSLLGWGVAK